MTAIVINEDNHGMIGLAKECSDAIKYLVINGWIWGYIEIVKEDGTITTIREDLGENYLDVISKWSIHKFNEYFEGIFYLRKEEIFEEIL